MMMSLAHVPVLLYHGVRDEPAAGIERFTLTRAAFARHAAAIADSGRTPLTMSQLAACLRGDDAACLPADPVAITFDDGWADTLPAVELLAARGIASTTYVQTGRLGGPDWLDEDGVRRLDAIGALTEVGAHTVDHPRLDELSGLALEREVAGSKAYLEDVLGHAVAGFAYPHGAHDERSRAAVAAAGYTHAAAVKNALSHPGDDPFAIARWTVTADVTADRLLTVLDGAAVPVVRAGDRPRTIAYRAARRLRRRLARPRTGAPA
jgi:peptidoglycan/xylan/chitin deacetylase (PgdA/CDA1 family)